MLTKLIIQSRKLLKMKCNISLEMKIVVWTKYKLLDEKKKYFSIASPNKMQSDRRNEQNSLDASFHESEPEKEVLVFETEKNER